MAGKEISAENILKARNALDNADMPIEGRLFRIICPHCGKLIELGDDSVKQIRDEVESDNVC